MSLTSPESSPRPDRSLRLALIICLACLAAGFFTFKKADRPWEGRLGRMIYGEQRAELGASAKYAGAIRFFLDDKAPGREKMKADDWIRFGIWVGALGFTVAAGIFAATSPWWVRFCRGGAKPGDPRSGWTRDRLSLAVLAAALVLAAVIRLPTLGGPILWDEQDNHRRNFHGYLDYREPGQSPRWVEATWKHSLWENERGNNPHLYSFFAWTSNQIWRAATGAPRERSNIVATRAPSAIFGLLSIVSVWWMLNAAGLPRLAPWAALLTAAHPLSAQFTLEARAYAITLFLTPILLIAAMRMIHLGRKRDFALFATGVFCSLLAFPGALYGIAAVNLAVAAWFVVEWRKGDPTARARLARWTVANSVAASAFLCFLAPGIPQMVSFMNNAFQSGVMPQFWYVVSYHLFSTGMHFGFPREPFFSTTGAPAPALPWLTGEFWSIWPVALWSLVVVPVLFVAGWIRFFRTANRAFFVVAAATFAGGVLCVAHHALVTGYYIYAWYAIYVLPVLIMVLVAGLQAAGEALARRLKPVSPAVATGLATALAACWMVWLSHPVFHPDGWRTAHVHVTPRPITARWSGGPGEIGRQTFLRGQSVWVVYEDGYHVWYRDHANKAEAWKPVIARKMEMWGQRP